VLLFWMADTAGDTATVSVLSPNGGEKLFTGASYRVAWTAEGAEIDTFDVEVSTNNGVTYNAIAGCTALPAAARQCVWASPGPTSSYGRVRVVAREAGNGVASDTSDARFSIVSGVPVVTVKTPNTAVNWGRGSTQQVIWSHNLGAGSFVRIEVSRDGGQTYALVAAGVKNTAASSGTFAWAVTGPNTTAALIRVTWENGSQADASNTAFVIADPFITLTTPSSGTNWGYATRQSQAWKTNLGAADRVNVLLSADGGQTFPSVLATDVVATALKTTIVTPTLAAPSAAARVRLTWANAPAGVGAVATSPANFKIEPPFVRITSPNGGETWTQGTAAVIRWLSNLGSLESVKIDLSTDDGQTYAVPIVASTPSSGKYTPMAPTGASTGTARLRLTWLANGTVSDLSDGAFRIQ
jgi:hypothetical protein